jgi:TP901 family phage tail tape measure protein
VAVVGLEFQVRSGNAVSETKKLTTATQQLEGAVNNTNNRLRDANGRYIAAGRSAAGASNGIRQFSVATAQATRSVGMLEGALGGLSAQLAVGLAFGQAIKSATEFESIISDIGKTSNASQKDLDAVAVALKDLSAPAKTNLAPTVLARGIQDLVAQGLNLSDAVASIEALGKVATATNSELTDVTKTGFQLQSALKIRPDELKATFDALAFAGKAGAFELKDMAQFMPTIASAATSLGITGKQGAISLAAMMQMVRKDAPGAAEASTRLTDALLKMTAPDAAKNFKKFGVDIEQVLKNAVKNGVNPMDAAVKELARVTGGDPFKLSQIFGDKEAKLALMSLMKYREEYEKLKASAGGAAAAGTVQGDFEKSLKTFQGQLNSLKAASEVAAISLGTALLPILAKLITAALPLIELVGDIAQVINALPQPVKDAAVEIIKLQLAFLLLNKVAGAFGGLKGAVVSALTATGSSAVAATGKINMLRLACASLARFALIGIVVEIAVFGLQSLQAAIRDVERANAKFAQQQKFGIAGPNDTREQIIKKQAQATKQLARAEAERNKITRRGQAKQSVAASTVKGIDGKPVPEFSLPPSVPTTDKTRLASLNKDIQMFKQTLKLNPNAFRSEKPQPETTNTLGPGVEPQGKEKKGSKGKKERESQLADIEAANGLFNAQNRIQARIFEATLLENQAEVLRLEYIQRGVELLAQSAEIQRSKDPQNEKEAKLKGVQDKLDASALKYAQDSVKAVQDRVKPLQDIVKSTQDKLKDDKEYQRLLAEGISPELAKQYIDIDKAYKLSQEKLPLEISAAEAAILQAKARGEDVSGLERQLDSLKQAAGMARDQARSSAEQSDAVQKQKKQTEDLQALYADLGMTIKSGVVDAIQGAVDGTKSLGEVASNVLKNIANKVLDVAINFALFGAMSGTGTGGGLLGGLFGKRAMGGPVSAGSSYMVGERGPELFTPKHGGSIVPNNALGGGSTSVVVNVDASGNSNVQGDQTQAKQLGVAVSAAVQAELVKQQRPGGLLAGTRR